MSWIVKLAGICLALGVAWSVSASEQSATHLDEGRALILAANSISGPGIDASDLRGRPVVVTFFASWCPPCTEEFEVLNKTFERYGPDRVKIVALNVFERFGGRDDPARMQRFLARTAPQFSVIAGSPEMRMIFGDIQRIPTLIVFDSEGAEAWRFIHERNAEKMSATFDEIDAVLTRLLAD